MRSQKDRDHRRACLLDEMSLRAREESLRLAIAAAQIGTWDVDAVGGGVRCDPICLEILRLPPDAPHTTESFLSVIHPEDQGPVMEAIARAQDPDGDGTLRTEFRAVHPTEPTRWISTTARSLFDDGGRLLRFAGTLLDITPRRQSHDALRHSERRYRSLVEATAAIIWDASATGEFTSDQPGWSAFTGQTPEAFRGWGWLEAVHPDDRPDTARLWAEAVEHESVYEIEHRLRRADGEYRHMHARAAPIRDESGRLVEWVGVHTDITERRLAHAALRFLSDASRILGSGFEDLEGALQRVAQLAVDTVAEFCFIDVLEEDGTFRRAAAAHRLPEHASGFDALLASVPPERLQALLQDVLRSGQPRIDRQLSRDELQRMAGSPERFTLLDQFNPRSQIVVPMRTSRGVLGVITLVATANQPAFTDEELAISLELGRRAQEAAENTRLYREAREAVRLRDEFLSVASHELKTPLTPLRLKLELAQTKLDRLGRSAEHDALAQDLQVALRQVGRLTTLVSGLLDVSRVSRGQLHLSLEQGDLAHVVREVVQRFEPQAARQGSALVLSARSAPGRFDPVRMDQVVTNLVDNALKYGSARPVDVTLAPEGEDLVLSVRDRGIGIDPDAHDRIFGRFERAVSERHYGGLGLGLYIVRSIVAAHGGGIVVSSHPNEGATFTVRIPSAGPPPP